MRAGEHSLNVVDTGWKQPPTRPQNEYRTYHPPETAAKLSTTVVHALADVMGVDVTNTEFSLYDSVDPDALNMIFAPKSDGTPRPAGHVAFCIQGYQITVYSEGQIVITPPRNPSN